MDALHAELSQLIIDTLNLAGTTAESVDVDAPLFGEGLGLDSLDALELVVALEYHYGIEKPLEGDEARAVFRSVRTLATFVAEHRTK
ncbi:MAG: acyl carrier protein [Deltaproteobacteria bacterium]|nr:acyl carrier protein [Deltaproteobacteria bacterium]MCB9787216.1 acyl carrier protein [Deltaproteobacteria bacterium]